MDASLRWFIVAIIVADLLAIVYFGGRVIAYGSLLPHKHEPHIVVAEALEAKSTEVEAKPAEPAFDLASYVADPVKGQRVAAKCKACQTFDQGGRHRTGPNMWAIYNAPIMHAPDFSYSSAFQDLEGQKQWTEDSLHAYLENPRRYIPGTKMQFNGIKDPQDRADLIAWLKTLQ
jgi:cytochrome c